jgi:hypothetical protein
MRDEAEEVSRDEAERALRGVLNGRAFRSSLQCQALLRYIVEHSLSQETEALRERVIGVTVFGRASNYDAGNDPVVRARAAEVRKRLAQHYMHEDGAKERIRIEIPSGSYRALFEACTGKPSEEADRAPGKSDGAPAGAAEQVGELTPSSMDIAAKPSDDNLPSFKSEQPRFNWSTQIAGAPVSGIVLLASALVVVGVLLFAAGYWTRTVLPSPQSDVEYSRQKFSSTNDPVSAFWGPFLKEDPSPIIVYADPIFLIDTSGDLLRFRRGAADFRGAKVDPDVARLYASNPTVVKAAGSLFYDNGYTGTGDLMAVSRVVAVLSRMGGTPRVQPSRQITLGDLKAHNVIIVGSTFQNVAVAELVSTGAFEFVEPDLHDPWSGRIVNTHPQPGEQSQYEIALDPATHKVRGDYALISFQPGLAPGRHIVLMAGIDTTGNEAAALFLSSVEGLKNISNALSHTRTGGQSPGNLAFQALLHVDIVEGSQVGDTRLVLLHSNAISFQGK